MAKNSGPRMRPDFGSFAGLMVALAGIMGGLLLEGGNIDDVTQATGAIIVLGGTIGAVMVTSPTAALVGAVRSLRLVFFQRAYDARKLVDDVLTFATRARRNGIVSLESDVDRIPDPFLRKALGLAVDGTDVQDLQQIMHLEIDADERRSKTEARVFDAAGGYAPTVGIIGAVLGLIQVMKHLDQIEMVGHGIAVAFVATIYGVGSANILFLPAAAKLRARAEEASRMKELMLDGVTSIVQGLHPKMIEQRLEPYLVEIGQPTTKARARAIREEAA
ncbi:MAG TPA: flagellar motor protein [Bryobacteraceae bacterium]|nr:flagellar motor protein [Bryobacteraceae bacterium]